VMPVMVAVGQVMPCLSEIAMTESMEAYCASEVQFSVQIRA